MSIKKTYLIPFVCFIFLIIFFARGLELNPRILPSALINKPAPAFVLTRLNHSNEQLTNKIFLGHIALLHVWATWCETCRAEHPVMMDLARASQVPIYALDYKDDRVTAVEFLKKFGDPYQAVGFDQKGNVSINWGVYGTPETFLVDSAGIIRYKLVGPITPDIWQEEILPRIKRLMLSHKR